MARALSILIVGDSPGDAELVAGRIEDAGYQVRWERVESAESLEAALPGGWQAVLCDCTMPGFSGLEALGIVRGSGLDLPVLFVSGTMGEDIAVEAMRAGARDYVPKDDLTRLVPALERELREAEERRQRRQVELERDKLRSLVLRDQQVNSFFATAAAGLVVLDKDLRFLHINETMADMNGQPIEEHLGRTVREVVPHLAPVVEPLLRHVLATGEPILNVEVAGPAPQDPENHRHWVESFFPVKGPDGAVAGVGATVMEITARKRAEEALRESEERFRALVESVTDYIYTVEIADGRVTRAVHSPGCLGVTGHTPQDYQADGYLWFRMVPEEDRRALWEQAQKLTSGQKVPPLEHRIVHKNGSIRWVRNTPVLRHDPQGRFVGYDGLIQDITEQRKLLEQWLQSQKMEAIGLLAGGIAHDFRNQLTVIRGYAEMLIRRGMVPDQALEHVRQIVKAADRSAELSAQLLAFSRQQELRPEVANLDDLIRGMSMPLASMVGEDIRLSIVPSDACHTVRVDPGQFHQAMMNLVVNARDAMPRGGQLTIEVRNVELGESFAQQQPGMAPGPHVMVAVTDTGTGIDKETIHRIFEPFFTTKPVGQGTGLGLAMVYGFVRQSGGCILAESEPGHGSTFRIYLPAAPGDQPSVPADAAAPADLPRGRGTILVVEDELAILDLLVSTLEECGYTVLQAAGPAEALSVAANCEWAIDLLISDVVMPEMSGPDMAAKILTARPGTPVLYLSGYTGKALADHGAAPSRANLLTKPFTSEALVRAVQALLPAADGQRV
jgi:two-component system, cell cycle sensor histidine kinase and response regulator CckA